MARKMPELYITMEDLERENACSDAVTWFSTYYPNGVALTARFIVRVGKTHPEWLVWLAMKLGVMNSDVELTAWRVIGYTGYSLSTQQLRDYVDFFDSLSGRL